MLISPFFHFVILFFLYVKSGPGHALGEKNKVAQNENGKSYFGFSSI